MFIVTLPNGNMATIESEFFLRLKCLFKLQIFVNENAVLHEDQDTYIQYETEIEIEIN